MKKLFENWRRLLSEGRWLFPKSKSDGPPPDPKPIAYPPNAETAEKVRKAKQAADAARAAEKYGPKTDDAETAEKADDTESKYGKAKMGPKGHQRRSMQHGSTRSVYASLPKNEGEGTHEGCGTDEGKSTKTIAVRVKRKELK